MRAVKQRRAVRRRLRDASSRARMFITSVLAAGILTLFVDAVPAVVALASVAVLFGLAVALAWSSFDLCPACDGPVDAMEDRHCRDCGASLEDVPVRPPDLDDEAAGAEGVAS